MSRPTRRYHLPSGPSARRPFASTPARLIRFVGVGRFSSMSAGRRTRPMSWPGPSECRRTRSQASCEPFPPACRSFSPAPERVRRPASVWRTGYRIREFRQTPFEEASPHSSASPRLKTAEGPWPPRFPCRRAVRLRPYGTLGSASTPRRRSLLPDWELGQGGGFGIRRALAGGSAAALGVIGFLNTIQNIVFALPGRRAGRPIRPPQAPARVPGRKHGSRGPSRRPLGDGRAHGAAACSAGFLLASTDPGLRCKRRQLHRRACGACVPAVLADGRGKASKLGGGSWTDSASCLGVEASPR
jgi:hypothetical protein